MKKFVLGFFTVCFASMSFAAAIRWGTSGLSITVPGATAPLAGATAYLIQGDATHAQSSLASLAAGTWTNPTSAPTGTSNAGGLIVTSTATDAGWTVGSYYDFYLVTLYTDTATNTDYYMVSAIESQKVYDSADVINSTPTSVTWRPETIGAISQGWQSVTVPEPTALALLALGVAGVALRRRKMA